MNAITPISISAAASLPPLLVDEREAARMLNISPRKLWEMEKNGTVKCVRIGRSKKYAISDLEDAIARLRSN